MAKIQPYYWGLYNWNILVYYDDLIFVYIAKWSPQEVYLIPTPLHKLSFSCDEDFEDLPTLLATLKYAIQYY